MAKSSSECRYSDILASSLAAAFRGFWLPNIRFISAAVSHSLCVDYKVCPGASKMFRCYHFTKASSPLVSSHRNLKAPILIGCPERTSIETFRRVPLRLAWCAIMCRERFSPTEQKNIPPQHHTVERALGRMIQTTPSVCVTSVSLHNNTQKWNDSLCNFKRVAKRKFLSVRLG